MFSCNEHSAIIIVNNNGVVLLGLKKPLVDYLITMNLYKIYSFILVLCDLRHNFRYNLKVEYTAIMPDGE